MTLLVEIGRTCKHRYLYVDSSCWSSAEKVKAFAKFLVENEEFDTQVTGHASKGLHGGHKNSAEYNLALSKKRADAIKNILVENGVASSRITATGKGFEEPIMSNETEEGRAANRRIDAILIKK